MPDTAAPTTPRTAPLSLAVIGAGPAGLALALQAARCLPDARITVFDARPADRDIALDPRTLALSQGSVQFLSRLGLWAAITAGQQTAPILEVRVSQQQPTVLWPLDREPEVRIRAQDEGVPQLGTVLSYGTLVAPMQVAWLQAVAEAPGRLVMRFGTPVRGLKPVDAGIEVDADIVERFDLAVVAEGGVFADQPALQWPQGVSRDYGQSAWVGQVRLQDDAPAGVAIERFTPSGPAALLPLPRGPVRPGGDVGPRAALVWCVNRDDDPVAQLDDAQRLALLNTVFPAELGVIRELSPLKVFPLGLNAHLRLVGEGPVARIGNAAQTLHPVAGQGLNLGLRDVHELLQALQHIDRASLGEGAVDRGTAVQRALARFERRRQPDRLALIAGTDFLARSFTWSAPVLATLRGIGLGVFQAAVPVRQSLARLMMFGHR